MIAIAWTVGPPARTLFRDGKDEFEQVQSVASGLGPIFINVSCVACHFAPAVGGSSGIIDTRTQRVEQAGLLHRVVDVASGGSRVGRFGWKAQQATLLAFSGDAYVKEMGITSRLFPVENAPNGDLRKLAACDAVSDPEDTGDDIVAFENFMRLLAVPPRDQDLNHGTSRGGRGRNLFEKVGCAVCHRGGFTAVSPVAAINGRTVDAFSDFLLHDVGTGDGIIQGDAPANVLRTPPLWGVSGSAPYLHDGSAATIKEAIRRHANQAAAARKAFLELSHEEQEALLEFLDSI